MKRIGVLVLLFVSSTSLLAQNAVRSYLVGTRGEAIAAAREILNSDLPERSGRGNFRAFESVNAFAAELTEAEVAQLRKSPRVLYVEEDVERHKMSDSVTPGQETIPYGVNMVNAPSVWPVTKGLAVNSSTIINVAILDTGISYDNPELARAYKGGWNTLNSTPDPRDDEGHGTHVAGTIAAAQNGTGVTGVAPDVNVWSVKVLDSCGNGKANNILAGLDWVINQKKTLGGNWIISMSLGGDNSSTTEQTAYQKAYDAGILTIAAAGNSGTSVLAFPAGYPSVVSIGAVDADQKIASFSQRGPDLKLVAPGVNVLSTLVGATVKTDDGRAFDAILPAFSTSAGKTLCAAPAQMTGPFVYSGFGGSLTDFPSSVAGHIALISRGNKDGAGTVSLTRGSTTIKGKQTHFTSEIHAGDSLAVCGHGNGFSVDHVVDDTTLVLTASAAESASDATYIPGITFLRKAQNAKAAGATGVIVFNRGTCGDAPTAVSPGLTVNTTSDVPPFLFISADAGAALMNTPSVSLTTGFGAYTFALENGTSMATPHASAVAALVWAVAPNATNEQVKTAIINNAHDLGDSGFDTTFGFGLVDAYAAAKALAPGAFSTPTQPPPSQPPLGRRSLKRGH